jgi:hypothetical protein
VTDPKTSSEARHHEFGAFLRSRRERLTPASVGLPAGFRRRTPGLRREEVALLESRTGKTAVPSEWYGVDMVLVIVGVARQQIPNPLFGPDT